MKMIPEQKALIEYGKALGRLEEFRRNHQNHPCVQNLTMRHFWRTAQVCCGQKTITNRHAELIRNAHQLWAMLRRTCWTCKHLRIRRIGKNYEDLTCPVKSIRIFNSQINRARNCERYEPKKEGE